ncbi:DUF5686 and carboxypeptidase regulatory-like domain-containing protein [Mucilaginibacter sp. RS28]|uniref:DUF5686 and carboxypeptidase regulatory-like domain-containing protein n=1 Tax=Mucilaginibacter straminoryzae TaxID=2932774 RepID=A0A9X2B8D0_9SPHI|nr:DUF5686 and carboxypeptidase regulatory-like domain-containing protein [Mucilaginibacter straminoryzae]MCJ8209341.1 DUF5686 and carboxypeptidase regulatory-like domain-containing protein [Mucilaginibacter straminoryzae]
MKIRLSLFLFLSISLQAFAQQFTISGTITDESGQAIPFATVVIRNATKGTSANAEGKFTLSVAAGKYELQFRAIGYTQHIQLVEIHADQILNVKLNSASYQLKDVVVRPGAEDPAYEIIRQAQRKRKTYLQQVNSYSCRVYIKGLQRLLAAPKKFLGRDIDQLAKRIGLDSNRRGILYLSESESKLDFMKPDSYHEEMISSKVSGSNRAFSFNRASDQRVDLYENYQNWPDLCNRPLVSPIADNALNFYNYKWLGTIEENGETINKIQLWPKHSFDAAFTGTIYITENSWRLHSYDLTITKSANLKLVDTLKISEQYLPVNPKVWMPATLRFEFTGGLFGFRFGGYFVSVYRDYDIEPLLNKKTFAEVMRITAGVNKKDSLYWEQQRPIPLTDEEILDYKKKGTLARKRESKAYQDSLDKANNTVTPKKVILTGVAIRNRWEKKQLYFNPLLTSLLYNTVEGFAINYGAYYTRQIDSTSNKYLRVNGNIRYGFSNHMLNGMLSATMPVKNYDIGFSGGTDMVDMNNTEPVTTFSNSYNSLLRKRNLQKLYEKRFASVWAAHRITGGWLASASAEFADRQWYPNTNYFSILYQQKKYTSNNPFTPDADLPVFPQNQSFKINITTSYDFSNQYVTYPSGRYYLPSNYPKIEVSYTKAIKNIFGSDASYNLLTAGVSKSALSLGTWGRSSFYIGGGKFFNRSAIYYTDYVHFLGDADLSYRVSPRRYLLLDLYKYSTPDKYLEGHFEHNFSGLFLNEVPLIRKLKLQEIVNFNYLSTQSLKNYFEVAGGVQYLNMRLMFARSFHGGTKVESGFRFGVIIP